MVSITRIGLILCLALGVATGAQAEQSTAERGYYYPQLPFYGGYNPYGYRTSAYPAQAQPVAKAAAPTPPPATPAAATAAEPDPPPASAAAEEETATKTPNQEPTAADSKTETPAQAAASAARAYPSISEHDLGAVSGAFGVESGRLGSVVTDSEGRTLYIPLEEPPAEASCKDDCSGLWRPFLMGEAAEPQPPFGAIPLADGSRQWSYAEKPLFIWLGDAAAGDVTGDGINGNWYAVRLSTEARLAGLTIETDRGTTQ